MKVLIVDNFDSFTYNLYQLVGSVMQKKAIPFICDVKRNNQLCVEQASCYDRIIISPGPGQPDDTNYFGVCMQIIQQLQDIPMLGICLGMQGMVSAFGGTLCLADSECHGKTSLVKHNQQELFKGLPNPLTVMRYHSIKAIETNWPDVLDVTAKSSTALGESVIMGIKHKTRPLYGLQFHPESFASQGGSKMIENFLWL